MTALLLLVALASEPQHRAPPEAMVQVAEAVQTANAGNRKAAIKQLDRVLAEQPGNVDAHVIRGVNRYFEGDHAGARSDLMHAFDGKAWVHDFTESQTGTDVTVTRTTLDLVEQRRVGAGILVLLAARKGEIDDGRALVKQAKAAFGPHPEGIAAEARLELAAGDEARAWKLLEGALAQPDPTRFVQSVVSEMLAKAPDSAPDSATTWLAEAGEWTAHHNAAIGAFRKKDYPGCVDEVRAGLGAFPDHPRMLEVGYPCAARADLAQATAWLDALGGPKKAEPWSVLAHARGLKQASRPDDALKLLDGLPDKLDGELPGQVQTLQLEILLAAKDLDRALKHCTGAAPVAELGVGYALIGAKRFKEAHGLLSSVCPALKGTTSAPTCDQYLEYAAANL